MMDKPLRILVVVNLAWDPRFGASRVFIELADEWTRMGHVVEKFSLTDAFPGPSPSGIAFAFRQWRFIYKAAAFVRKNRDRFDVIDALIGSLPFSKTWLRFKGLLVARSVGLPRFYDRFEQSVDERWPGQGRGRLAGRALRSFIRWRSLRACDKSIQHADVINLPNEEEADALRHDAVSKKQALVVQPFGLGIEHSRALAQAALSPRVRLERKKICFIGMWGARKGAYDWGQIIRQIRQRVPDALFSFIGTMADSKTIRRDLGEDVADGCEFIPQYEPGELPALLADCTAGAFPSYVEGFGLAVIEQLAAGVPTVAYDVAGPRHMLGMHLPELLVATGDTTAFAEAISRILQGTEQEYESLLQRSVVAASHFSWPAIARETLHSYQIARGRN